MPKALQPTATPHSLLLLLLPLPLLLLLSPPPYFWDFSFLRPAVLSGWDSKISAYELCSYPRNYTTATNTHVLGFLFRDRLFGLRGNFLFTRFFFLQAA
jgi:hypothetical protein